MDWIPTSFSIAFDRLVDVTKLRWRIERDYQELKQELGLGHYEGRGWQGFSALTRRRLRRGVFKSVVDLQADIKRYLDEHNLDRKPFVWTKPADVILAKISRLPVPSV